MISTFAERSASSAVSIASGASPTPKRCETISANGIAAVVAGHQRQRPLVDEQVLAADPEHREVAPAQHGGVERLLPHVDERADLDQEAAVAHHLHRLRERAREAGGVDDEVDALAVREVAHLGGDGGLGAREPRREVEPAARGVDGDDPARAHQRRLDRVRQPERADADHGHGRAGPEARRARQPRRSLEAVGDREDLGQHRHVVRQPLGHAEDRRARLQVQEVGPAAEQMRRVIARQRVAVVLDVAAEVVREAAGAHPAVPAGAVGRRHDAVADRERRAVAGARAAVPDRGHDADVLVALDDRVGRRARVLGARVLLGLTAVGVLVGAADPRREHPQQHRARLDLVRDTDTSGPRAAGGRGVSPLERRSCPDATRKSPARDRAGLILGTPS